MVVQIETLLETYVFCLSKQLDIIVYGIPGKRDSLSPLYLAGDLVWYWTIHYTSAISHYDLYMFTQ